MNNVFRKIRINRVSNMIPQIKVQIGRLTILELLSILLFIVKISKMKIKVKKNK